MVAEAEGVALDKRLSPLIRWIGFHQRTNSTTGDSANESMQHFLAGVEVVFARGVQEGSQEAQGRTTRAGFHQLGPVHGHVVLPGGTGAFLARDLRRSGVLRRAAEADAKEGTLPAWFEEVIGATGTDSRTALRATNSISTFPLRTLRHFPITLRMPANLAPPIGLV